MYFMIKRMLQINRWQIAIVLYIVVIAILVILKPSMMFTAEEEPKVWGIETNETTSIFSPMIVFPLLSIVAYYIGVWIELMFIESS